MHRQMAKAFSTSTADAALGLISTVWKYADRFLDVDLKANPTRDVVRVHEGTKEHEPWPTDVIEAFDKGAPPTIRLARLLAYYTGQRRHDLVQMDWSRFNGDRIEVVCQSKGGGYLSIPCHPVLLAELLPLRKAKGPIINSRGRAYTANSLSNAFRKVFVQIGIDGYSVHGLRKNAAVALAEVGCEPHEIMSITGHKTLAMVTHYTKRANQKRLADRAMEKWKTAKSG
jgi:integrase